MRIARLDLIAYGHFTGRRLDFPAGGPDLHIVFGANEAGKSTALAAIEDLLFGIPQRSPHGFLHGYEGMRIGAEVEDSAGAFALVRRKSRKDSLVDGDGVPLADGGRRLLSALGGADRGFFERMFSLDRIRLERGGQAMLDPEDDASQAVFAAGAGLGGLRETLGSLSDEAEGLWAPRKARHRRFYEAQERLDEASKALREHTLSVTRWRELRRARNEAQRAFDAVEAEFRDASADAARLSRIRRVLADVRHRAELAEQLEGLGDAPALAEDARERLEASQQEIDRVTARVETLQDQFDKVRREAEGLAWDERLVAEAARIADLDRQRIELARGRADLPKRRAELETMEGALRALAAEIGWSETDTAAVAARIPQRPEIQAVHAQLRRLAELDTEAASHRQELGLAKERLDGLRRRRGDGAPEEAPDGSGLAAAIAAVRMAGDIDGRVRAAEQALADAGAEVERLRSGLHPAIDGWDPDAAILHPPLPAVQRHGEARQELERDRRDLDRRRAETEDEVGRHRDGAEGLRGGGRTVSGEDLERARAERDRLWRRFREGPAEGGGADGALAGAVEEAVRAADLLADRRFETAEASARLAEISRAEAAGEARLSRLKKREAALDGRERRLEQEWLEMWQDAPVAPLSPDVMERWIGACAALAAAAGRERQAASDLARERAAERDARDSLVRETAALGADPGADPGADVPVAQLLERADGLRAEIDERARADAALRRDIEAAEQEAGRLEGRLSRAEEALQGWRRDWSGLMAALGLPPGTAAEAAEAHVETIDRMRQEAGAIEELRDRRIARIERDIESFESQVTGLASDLGVDVAGRSPDELVAGISRLGAEAEQRRAAHADRTRKAEALAAEIDGLAPARREAESAIERLRESAGAGDVDTLREAIGRSERRRRLERELGEAEARLAAAGDGRTMEELARECADVDPDTVAADEGAARGRLELSSGRRSEAAVALAEAEGAFAAAGGGDAAAKAEAGRQEGLAGMAEAAERYVRTGASAILLRWAIDRYRRERQGPLLQSAGEVFGTLTQGSFSALQIDYDDRERPVLAGRRPDGATVPVGGMSDGTADQLYLALRIAALGEYLGRMDALPFIADDLFVNFDDGRAAAGFEALGRLAGRTQVLFFTHHRHLVSLARDTLGEGISVAACDAGDGAEDGTGDAGAAG